GVYHTLKYPERIIYTFEWEAMPDHVLLETFVLEELPGNRTRVTEQSLYQSVADRDGMLATGMQDGAVEMVKRLSDLLSRVATH
ncbi:ATPase, partial [bacterium]